MRRVRILSSLFLFFLMILSSNSQAAYRLLEIHVDSKGEDLNFGTVNSPVQSFTEVKKRIGVFMSKLDPEGIHRNDYIKIRIIASGTFHGQSINWDYPHQNVHLDFKAADGKEAIFYGYRHPDFNSKEGPTFFSAWSRKSKYINGVGVSGFGTLSLRGLTIKSYGTGVLIGAWGENKPTFVSIQNNVFFKIGQIANPDNWKALYSAIILRSIDNAVIKDNKFINIGNKADDHPEFMHSIYLDNNSDGSIITDNYFENNSGEPVKIRNGSDHTEVTRNTFKKSLLSVHLFPIQNWYAQWWLSDEDWLSLNPGLSIKDREIPSFGTVIKENVYLNGYVNTVFNLSLDQREILCTNRTFASPLVLPNTYVQAANKSKTYARLIIDGKKVYNTHWYQNVCPKI